MIALRVVLVTHGLTEGMRRHAFGAHGDLVRSNPKAVSVLRQRLGQVAPHPTLVARSPDAVARHSACLLDLAAPEEPALAELGYGTWVGRTLTEIGAEDPDGVRSWLADPYTVPHGGESVAAQVTRVGRWLDSLGEDGQTRVVGVTHPSVARAALVHTLRVPLDTYWRLDCEPWSAVVLSWHGSRWNLRL